MARRKNTKRIDPRWFMDEKTDTINEASIKRKSRPSDTIPEPEPTDNVMMNIALVNDYYDKTGQYPSWAKEELEARDKRIAAARANAGKYGSVSKHLEEESFEEPLDEGFLDSLKGAAGAVGAKASDAIKGTGNLYQTTQATKQITALVQKLAKDGYGGPAGARSLAQHLQGLADQILADNPKDDVY